jgi:hypothetical protein
LTPLELLSICLIDIMLISRLLGSYLAAMMPRRFRDAVDMAVAFAVIFSPMKTKLFEYWNHKKFAHFLL